MIEFEILLNINMSDKRKMSKLITSEIHAHLNLPIYTPIDKCERKLINLKEYMDRCKNHLYHLFITGVLAVWKS